MDCDTAAWPETRQLSDVATDRLLTSCLTDFAGISLAVTGRCMVPALPEGSRVLLDGRRPRMGDVVLVRQPRGLVLHRLIWGPPFAWGGTWRTKADRSTRWDGRFVPSRWIATVQEPPGAA